MFDKQRYIPPADKEAIEDLVDFLLNTETTKSQILEIKKDLKTVPGRIRMGLGMLSIRNGGRFKIAFDRVLGIK